MTDVIQFFDPKLPCGVLKLTNQASDNAQGNERVVELQDVALQSSGQFAVTLIATDTSESNVWIGMPDLREEDDGSLFLLLADTGCVVFPTTERVRVSNLFLRLANRHY